MGQPGGERKGGWSSRVCKMRYTLVRARCMEAQLVLQVPYIAVITATGCRLLAVAPPGGVGLGWGKRSAWWGVI